MIGRPSRLMGQFWRMSFLLVNHNCRRQILTDGRYMQGHRDWHKGAYCLSVQQRRLCMLMYRGYDRCLLAVGAIKKKKESVLMGWEIKDANMQASCSKTFGVYRRKDAAFMRSFLAVGVSSDARVEPTSPHFQP